MKQKLSMELLQMAMNRTVGPSCEHSNLRLRTRYLMMMMMNPCLEKILLYKVLYILIDFM